MRRLAFGYTSAVHTGLSMPLAADIVLVHRVGTFRGQNVVGMQSTAGATRNLVMSLWVHL